MARRVAGRAGGDGGYAGVTRVTDKGGGVTSSGHIKVVVRVRPPNTAETSANSKDIVRVLDEHVLVFDPNEQPSDDFYHGKRRTGRDLNKRKNRDVRFAFDHVFSTDAQNEDIYEKTMKVILDGLLDGFNCSVFAYGATGAGKTFTMLGKSNHPGVMFLTTMDLYERIETMKEDKTCDVAVSYLEVYNEQILDLLVPKGYLPLREDPRKGAIVSGLSLHKPQSAEELLKMLNFGNKNRTQHPTDANAESSRSHAVFQVFVRQRDRTANISADVRVAKMALIDLAGSERATVTTNRGARFREGANINKSLLALGNCINALADGKSKGYVPYRNSKLTRLLKDSLGGNCRTVMIAAISPSSMSYEDTYNTLNYANRAKNIKAELKRNVLSVDFHISKYAKIVDELRQEVTELRTKLKNYEEGALAVSYPPVLPSGDQEEVERLSIELRVTFEDRRNIRQELLELESMDRDLAIKLYTKERHLTRVRSICPASNDKASGKINHMIESTRLKQERVRTCKQRLRGRLEQNASRLTQVEQEVTHFAAEGKPSQLLECRLKMHHQDIEIHDTRRHVRCLQNVCRFQHSQANTTDKLLLTLLQAYRQVFFTLKGHNLATNDLVSQFEKVQHLVEGEREVAWADQPANDSQVYVDYDKPLLDQILRFPVLSTRSQLRNSTTPTTTPGSKLIGSLTPSGPITPLPTPSLVHKLNNPPGIYTPGPPGLAATPPPPILKPTTLLQSEPQPRVTTVPHVPVQATVNTAQSLFSDNCVVTSKGGSLPLGGRAVPSVTIPQSDRAPVPRPSAHSPVVHQPQLKSILKRPSQMSQVQELRVSTSQEMDSTFTMEGVAPLQVSPDTVSRPVSNSCDIGDGGPCDGNTPCRPGNTPCRPVPMLTGGTVTVDTSVRQAYINNGTVTKTTASIVTRPLSDATPCRPHNVDTVTKTSVTNHSSTVTKSQLSVSVIGATVTKQKPSEINPSENLDGVKRSIEFSDQQPSPAGKLTFAEALKSPGVALARRQSSPVVRSPLASCENIPTQSLHYAKRPHGSKTDSGIPSKQRTVGGLSRSMSSVRSVSALAPRSNHTQKSLHRMGLPSTSDMRDMGRTNNPQRPGHIQRPSYMQSTTSVSKKSRHHRRSISMEQTTSTTATLGRRLNENITRPGEPRRRVNDENRPAHRQLFNSRSKSVSKLPQRDRFF